MKGKGGIMGGNFRKIFLVLACCVLLTSCRHSLVTYDYRLSDVEQLEDATERDGEYGIRKATSQTGNYSYEDEIINSLWSISEDRMNFEITNKSDNSIRILWDEAAYVNIDNYSSRIMHSGMEYTNRNLSLPPSIIVRKAFLRDAAIPLDNISYDDYEGWIIAPLIGNTFYNEEEAQEFADKVIGRKIQLLLPMEINNTIHEYIFVFEIDDYSVSEEMGM